MFLPHSIQFSTQKKILFRKHYPEVQVPKLREMSWTKMEEPAEINLLKYEMMSKYSLVHEKQNPEVTSVKIARNVKLNWKTCSNSFTEVWTEVPVQFSTRETKQWLIRVTRMLDISFL